MIFIVGGRGLTGSAFVRYAENNGLEFRIVQRENRDEFFNAHCDVLIYANGNALKYKANEDPVFDLKASVLSTVEYVHRIKYKTFIHISSIDVYSDPGSLDRTREEAEVDVLKLTPYGYHKHMAEDYVRRFCPHFLIFRLPGLVGPGLKKNPAFDYMHSHKKVMISTESRLNFIDTDFMAKTAFSIYQQGITNETFNLCATNSIRISDIKSIVGFDSQYTDDAQNYIQSYEINSEKISKHCDLMSTEEALTSYARYIGIL